MAYTMIVGLGNKARHGKDTAAKTIIAERSDRYDIRKYAFADELKKEVNELEQFEECFSRAIKYDGNPDMTDPMCQTRHGKQVHLLQFWGQHRRSMDKFYWVKKVAAQIVADQPQVAIISDLRYKSEFYWVKSMKGFTVRVSRQGFVDLTRDPKHVSEIELDEVKWDVEINVLDGELEQLKKDAVTVFDLLVAQLTPVIDAEIPSAIILAAA